MAIAIFFFLFLPIIDSFGRGNPIEEANVGFVLSDRSIYPIT
jgi:hypothetical protein